MSEDDILTFEQLSEIERQERKEDTLTELDDDFFQQVADYLRRKRQIADRTDDSEFRKIKHVVEDIIDSRQKKIVKLAFLASKSDFRADNILPEEQEFFQDVEDRIGRHREHLESIVLPDEDPETAAAPAAERDTTKTVDSMREDVTTDTDTADTDTAVDDEAPTEGTETADDTTPDTEDSGESADATDTGDQDTSTESGGTPGTDDETDDDGEELLFGGTDDEDDPDEGDTSDDGSDDTGDGRSSSQDDSRGTNGMVMLIATEEIPAFMGVDLEEYGPFEEGDEIQVPADNAEALVDQDRAERI